MSRRSPLETGGLRAQVFVSNHRQFVGGRHHVLLNRFRHDGQLIQCPLEASGVVVTTGRLRLRLATGIESPWVVAAIFDRGAPEELRLAGVRVDVHTETRDVRSAFHVVRFT